MAKTFSAQNTHSAPVDMVLEVLTDPEFLVEREKAQGAIEAHVEEVERKEDKLVLQLHATEYGRTMTGGLDKNKREKSTTTYRWDLKAKRGDWTYQGTHGEKIKVSGSFQVAPLSDEKSQVTSTFSVQVKIPLLGGKIEKMVIKEIQAGHPKSADVLRRFLKKAS